MRGRGGTIGPCSYAYSWYYDWYERRRLPPARGDHRRRPAAALDRRGEGLDRGREARFRPLSAAFPEGHAEVWRTKHPPLLVEEGYDRTRLCLFPEYQRYKPRRFLSAHRILRKHHPRCASTIGPS